MEIIFYQYCSPFSFAAHRRNDFGDDVNLMGNLVRQTTAKMEMQMEIEKCGEGGEKKGFVFGKE